MPARFVHASAVVLEEELVVVATDDNGRVWRTGPDERWQRLPAHPAMEAEVEAFHANHPQGREADFPDCPRCRAALKRPKKGKP